MKREREKAPVRCPRIRRLRRESRRWEPERTAMALGACGMVGFAMAGILILMLVHGTKGWVSTPSTDACLLGAFGSATVFFVAVVARALRGAAGHALRSWRYERRSNASTAGPDDHAEGGAR